MHNRGSPDEPRLFAVADDQLGHFTARQARDQGYTSAMLAYHAGRGKFIRLGSGVYRFTQYPHSRHEEAVAAWLAVGTDAVVSHETALDFHGLSDVIPDSVHLTLPRNRRYRHAPPGVTLHTATAAVQPEDRTRHVATGLPVTTAVRTILDVAAARAPLEEVVKAVADALRQGLTTAGELPEAARRRGPAMRRTIEQALSEAGAL
jgi:predicted transcriptional regulator of viral defense system